MKTLKNSQVREQLVARAARLLEWRVLEVQSNPREAEQLRVRGRALLVDDPVVEELQKKKYIINTVILTRTARGVFRTLSKHALRQLSTNYAACSGHLRITPRARYRKIILHARKSTVISKILFLKIHLNVAVVRVHARLEELLLRRQNVQQASRIGNAANTIPTTTFLGFPRFRNSK